MTTLHLPADVPGARGISTKKHGDVLLEPGEVREDLDLSAEEVKRAEANDLVEGKPKKAAADKAAKSDEAKAEKAAGKGGADPKTEPGGEANAKPAAADNAKSE